MKTMNSMKPTHCMDCKKILQGYTNAIIVNVAPFSLLSRKKDPTRLHQCYNSQSGSFHFVKSK